MGHYDDPTREALPNPNTTHAAKHHSPTREASLKPNTTHAVKNHALQ